MILELWDLESRNLVGDFDSLGGALEVVREAVAANGAAYVRAYLELGAENDAGESWTLAGGDVLASLAERSPDLGADGQAAR